MNEGTIEIDKWKHMSPEEIENMGGQKTKNGKSPLLIQSKCIYTPDELIEQIKEKRYLLFLIVFFPRDTKKADPRRLSMTGNSRE